MIYNGDPPPSLRSEIQSEVNFRFNDGNVLIYWYYILIIKLLQERHARSSDGHHIVIDACKDDIFAQFAWNCEMSKRLLSKPYLARENLSKQKHPQFSIITWRYVPRCYMTFPTSWSFLASLFFLFLLCSLTFLPSSFIDGISRIKYFKRIFIRNIGVFYFTIMLFKHQFMM